MKAKNLGKPDYASIEDRRPEGKPAPSYYEALMKRAPYKAEDYKAVDPYSAQMNADAMASASEALSRMGNKPLPSRSVPKGNNPGSVSQMKFPKTARSK